MPIAGTTAGPPAAAFPVALAAAFAVALLIWLATLDSKELAAAPAEEVAEAATEPSDEVADARSEASDDSSVVCEASALPAAEVSELMSEARVERASDCGAGAGFGLGLAETRVESRRRMAVGATVRETCIFGLWCGVEVGWLVIDRLSEQGLGLWLWLLEWRTFVGGVRAVHSKDSVRNMESTRGVW